MASSGQARAESKSHQDKIQLLKQAVSSSISPSEFPLIWLCLSSYHFFPTLKDFLHRAGGSSHVSRYHLPATCC